jgi:CxxC motif-containing protein
MNKKDDTTQQFVCVHCPKGCVITAEGPTEDLELTGAKCKHGKEYAEQELMEPKRVLTTTVRVKDCERMLPVRSTEPVPKERLFEVMALLDEIVVEVPIKCGDTVIKNVLDLDADIIATWSIGN